MKRFLSLVLAMLIAITMLIIPASAENYATAVVKGGWLRLRAEASASSETISAYFTGTQVTIIGTSGEWYYVLTPDGHYGFMNSNYLTVTGSSSGSTTTESTAYIYAANGKPVRMRSGPSTDYGVIASYSVGTQVKVLISGADWSKIRVGTRTGYIMSKFLSVTNITPSTPSSSYTAYVTASNGKPVRMRSGPSTDYGVIASYSVGTQVKVLISGADWSKIRVGTRTGYIMSKFLSVTNITPSTPSSSYTAYVTASNGKPVRMRTGAGTNYSVISTYNVGTQVTVLEYGKTWCRIRVNGYTGYMMTKFLTTTQPTIISSAALNKNTVWPGETLTVTTNPANISVSYEWLNDAGARLGTGSTYTVKTSDTGRRIRVRVTGKNGTTGSVVSGWAAVQGNGTVGTVYQLKALTLNTTNAVVGTTLTATIAPSGATANIYWYLDNGTYLGYGSSYTVQPNALGRRIFAYAEGTNSTTGTATSAYTDTVTAGATPSIVLSSVTLYNYSPTVGTVLTATIAPANATATILWYRDDNVYLGTGMTYTVTATDVGHRIYAWAQGTGSTSGNVTSPYTQQVTAGTSYRIDSVTLNSLNPIVGQTLVASVAPYGATATITWYRDDSKILSYGATYTVQADDIGYSIYVWAEGTGNTTGSATSRITSEVKAN
mgnify:CR=1 FL=1